MRRQPQRSNHGRTTLRALQRIVHEYTPASAESKLALLRALSSARTRTARDVLALHEALIFLRAYPDDARVLAASERGLRQFAQRADLGRFRSQLENSGIAGTDVVYRFYPPTANWLVSRFGALLSIEWDDVDQAELLERNLWLLLLWGESSALDIEGVELRERVRRLKGPRESDAEFLVRRIDALPMHVFARERFGEELDLPMRLAAGPATPSRTLARAPSAAPVFQTRPLRRARPDLAREIRRPPLAVREMSAREGGVFVRLAREAMVARERDLEAFMHADERDVRVVECGDGLQFAVMGVRPDRRLLLESVYGMLTIQNGVPIGYVLASALFGSAEVAYNVFEAYRGAEAAHVYARALATIRVLFGAETFSVPPYQLGHENEEGLASGAWWFYAKLGFRPRDGAALRLATREIERARRDPKYRSSKAKLRALVERDMFFALGRERADVLGTFPLPRVGAAISAYVARRFGADRERAASECAAEAARLLGVRAWHRLPRDERLAFERWAPLVACMPGVARWSAADRRALGAIMCAKGARREADAIALLDRHARARAALRALVRG